MAEEDITSLTGCSEEKWADCIGDLMAVSLPIFDLTKITSFSSLDLVGKTMNFRPELLEVPRIRVSSKTPVEVEHSKLFRGRCVQKIQPAEGPHLILVFMQELGEDKFMYAIKVQKLWIQ